MQNELKVPILNRPLGYLREFFKKVIYSWGNFMYNVIE